MRSVLLTTLRSLGGLVLGVATGVAAVAVHQYVWGLALALVAAVATALALRAGAARLLMSAGLAAVVLRGSLLRPEGDFLVLANGPQLASNLGDQTAKICSGDCVLRHVRRSDLRGQARQRLLCL